MSSVVRDVHARYAGRPLRDYVPLFVERNATTELEKTGRYGWLDHSEAKRRSSASIIRSRSRHSASLARISRRSLADQERISPRGQRIQLSVLPHEFGGDQSPLIGERAAEIRRLQRIGRAGLGVVNGHGRSCHSETVTEVRSAGESSGRSGQAGCERRGVWPSIRAIAFVESA